MADTDETPGEKSLENIDFTSVLNTTDQMDSAFFAFQMSWRWADFHIYIIDPIINSINPPLMIKPAEVEEGGGVFEHVYSILDKGYCLSTSPGEDLFSVGMSMCKLHYTIEKMVAILVARLKERGVATETEVKIAFSGFVYAQRKGFESIINLNHNVVVTNFDPGAWGERYLETVKHLADNGYGYPQESPRDNYRHSHDSSSGGPKR